jgi:hypothetical protein
VVSGFFLDIHGVASRAILTGYRLFFPFRAMPTLIWIKKKAGIFCSEPPGQHGSDCQRIYDGKSDLTACGEAAQGEQL